MFFAIFLEQSGRHPFTGHRSPWSLMMSPRVPDAPAVVSVEKAIAEVNVREADDGIEGKSAVILELYSLSVVMTVPVRRSMRRRSSLNLRMRATLRACIDDTAGKGKKQGKGNKRDAVFHIFLPEDFRQFLLSIREMAGENNFFLKHQ